MRTDKLKRARLLDVLEYNRADGVFRWKVSRGPKKAGSVAGNIRPDGYIYIAIDQVIYRQSRLAWMYVRGKWPNGHIDHKNRNTSDDRFSNLRDATRSQNLGNRKINKNNAIGLKGVCRANAKFMANINIDKKRVYLGVFDTAEEAHAAYALAAKTLFREFARAA